MKTTLVIAALLALMVASAFAQDNCEIQVYPSETVDPGITMVELHCNYTPRGMTFTDGVRPSQDAVHETLEITHGFNPWFEVGFYSSPSRLLKNMLMEERLSSGQIL